MCDILGAGRLLESKYVHILGLYHTRIKEDQIVIGRGVGLCQRFWDQEVKKSKMSLIFFIVELSSLVMKLMVFCHWIILESNVCFYHVG